MNAADVGKMVEGLTDETKTKIIRELKVELGETIAAVNTYLRSAGLTSSALTPPTPLLLEAFKLCPFETTQVVILGQDPFIRPGEAMGLSFSVPPTMKVPPSTKNIYKCLINCGLMATDPGHGDLSSWARQGVLLLNCALSTILGKSNALAVIWKKYTDKVIAALSAGTQKIFILLGEFAKKKASLIDKTRHIILEWGHPSSLNAVNKKDCPENFVNCDVFIRANAALVTWGRPPIDWNIAPLQNNLPMVREIDQRKTLWIFCDGGALANGKEKCISSWGYYTFINAVTSVASGIVPAVDIPGEIFKGSNNRGELMAIAKALDYVNMSLPGATFTQVIIVSDSQYALNSINVWVNNWLTDPAKMADKKNLDIILPAKVTLDNIRKSCPVTFEHVRGHKAEPADNGSMAWFLWKGNDVADKLCAAELEKIRKP